MSGREVLESDFQEIMGFWSASSEVVSSTSSSPEYGSMSLQSPLVFLVPLQFSISVHDNLGKVML